MYRNPSLLCALALFISLCYLSWITDSSSSSPTEISWQWYCTLKCVSRRGKNSNGGERQVHIFIGFGERLDFESCASERKLLYGHGTAVRYKEKNDRSTTRHNRALLTMVLLCCHCSYIYIYVYIYILDLGGEKCRYSSVDQKTLDEKSEYRHIKQYTLLKLMSI